VTGSLPTDALPVRDEGALEGLTAGLADLAAGPASMLPIVVDLDETLVLTDTLHEQALFALFHQPFALLRVLPRLLEGRAAVKAGLAADLPFAAVGLPLRADLVAWLEQQAARGREIHLCSAANTAIVQAVAARIGFFKTAIGSSETNLKGQAKADLLTRLFPVGFVYVGDSRADLAVWQAASGVVLAGASASVATEARALGKPVEAEFVNQPLSPREVLKALRVHHWLKNLLVFVPILLGHGWNDHQALLRTALGLICLLAVTSATYILNDIADIDADRQHWSKRGRAIASGRLAAAPAFLSAIAAILVALGFAIVLAPPFAGVLAAYLTLTLAYSFGLKRIPLLDTLIIGILFTSRLVMGITLAGQAYSEWLLTFSMFFFFSLATAKRHTEVVRAGTSGSGSIAARGYEVGDAALTLVFGVATAVASLLIMVLFIVDEVLRRGAYGNPKMLWGIPVVLAIWVGRIWLLAHRGRMNDDPVSFALRDKISIMLGTAVGILFVLAL
jgi:4-hydroxybenzoate polyprenyltransferase/phosphoserine phosphatase